MEYCFPPVKLPYTEFMPSRALVTIALFVVLIGFGTADALFVEKILPFGNGSSQSSDPAEPGVTVSGEPVRKAEGPDVMAVVTTMQFTTQNTDEQSILSRVVTGSETIDSKVLLQNNDRAAFIAWVDATDVKTYFLSLKEALHRSFTASVTDLLDEAQQREGLPTRNILTFRDVGILPERVVFVRVRERLYEFHVPEGKDDLIFALIEELTK